MASNYIKIHKNWLPYAKMTDRRGFISLRFGSKHTGVDSVGNRTDNEICAVVDGVVTKVDFSKKLGNIVIYRKGNIQIAHYHLKSASVSVGEMVKAEETIIGIEGKTGELCRGKHLHTSMWIDGVLVDPEPYLCGEKTFDLSESGETIMVRKVIRDDLNLREKPGVVNKSFGFIPVGTIINPIESVKIGSAVWAKHSCIMRDGKEYTGWSNIQDFWSEPYSGPLMTFKPESSEMIKIKAELQEAKQKIASAKAALN